jgi:hypothetical protein
LSERNRRDGEYQWDKKRGKEREKERDEEGDNRGNREKGK